MKRQRNGVNKGFTNTYERLYNKGLSNPDDEAFGLTDGPQTRMKPGFVRNQVYYSYNNFTTI